MVSIDVSHHVAVHRVADQFLKSARVAIDGFPRSFEHQVLLLATPARDILNRESIAFDFARSAARAIRSAAVSGRAMQDEYAPR